MEEKIFLENFERKKKSIGLIHKVYLAQLKNSRKYTACTKTKSEVRGGGKKPWRQKGTGNARAGSSRSPLWVGGGVSFGPKPRVVFKKINKKEKGLAILSALYLKKKQFFFVNEENFLNFSEIKTKNILNFLKNIGINPEEKILLILSKPNKELWLASRNLKNFKISTANSINLELILKTNHILLSTTSLESINLNYGKSYT
jgi:large subunit ribosomal protein L4